jgi:transcription elongation factor GreB
VTASSPYITPDGRAALEEEFAALWQRRGRTTAALATAAAEGDRSENAEYIYRKKELREIDRRLSYLQRRIPELKVVLSVQSQDRIYFGAWVTVEDESGSENTWRLVGPDEFARHPGYISIDAPLARALLGKGVGDEITVTVNGRKDSYVILEIEYR